IAVAHPAATFDGWDWVSGSLAEAAHALGESPLDNAAQAVFCRDIFGNPFRPVSLDPICLTPAVLSLAQAAYEERILSSGKLDPSRLFILADALEEAGCTGPALLGHLRSPGPHVRGCHVVDAILGKQ